MSQEQLTTTVDENSVAFGLHKYLLAKNLLKETWKQL